jgi:hypothetical protein
MIKVVDVKHSASFALFTMIADSSAIDDDSRLFKGSTCKMIERIRSGYLYHDWLLRFDARYLPD